MEPQNCVLSFPAEQLDIHLTLYKGKKSQPSAKNLTRVGRGNVGSWVFQAKLAAGAFLLQAHWRVGRELERRVEWEKGEEGREGR